MKTLQANILKDDYHYKVANVILLCVAIIAIKTV